MCACASGVVTSVFASAYVMITRVGTPFVIVTGRFVELYRTAEPRRVRREMAVYEFGCEARE